MIQLDWNSILYITSWIILVYVRTYVCYMYVFILKKQNNYKRQIQNIEMAFNLQELRFSLGIHR